MATPRKRALDTFFKAVSPPPKKARVDASCPKATASSSSPNRLFTTSLDQPSETKRENKQQEQPSYSNHPTYPHLIKNIPSSIQDTLGLAPASEGRIINDKPDLDLLYFEPWIPKEVNRQLFQFLRKELPFYRVKYRINRGGIQTDINTPRFTTVFGVDDTASFSSEGEVLDAKTKQKIPEGQYKCRPRPIPESLDVLRKLTEGSTEGRYNFCLVNYYADGNDSISYHSDDERFLGPDPSIASFSLGAKRDFLMRHKPAPGSKNPKGDASQPSLKLPLSSGDMILMRGKTQEKWLHSIPKRKGGDSERGRINVTFRRAIVRGGTENYYNYNVGQGEVYRWDDSRGEMRVWQPEKEREQE